MPIEEILKRFEIGEPLRSLFQPRFDAAPLDLTEPDATRAHFFRVRLTCHAPDAYEERQGGVSVILDQYFEHGAREEYYLEGLRAMLKQFVTHEVDEAIKFNGLRIFDPHRSSPR